MISSSSEAKLKLLQMKQYALRMFDHTLIFAGTWTSRPNRSTARASFATFVKGVIVPEAFCHVPSQHMNIRFFS
ncbi:hypothetical protein CKAH01_08709 [Colletotrichum kahawae]|uniref:Uncharacterized protein n=1 Tax=Colletotrichum kahawae TaxID=34407 RepID=A0AAE0CZG2_COLKA|nr:hypothetical protein CKAH01_08709 [Colletotrichum kahawae]